MVCFIKPEVLLSQSKSFSNLYIPEKAFISFSGEHRFVKENSGFYPGIISTAREGEKGHVNFLEGSGWRNASHLQHVDGYVKVYHDQPFTFPIGSNGRYRPVAITGARKTSAAYFDSDPELLNGVNSSTKDQKIARLSSSEYWDINGTQSTIITLTWDESSSIEKLTEKDINRLAIVGWKNNQWEVIKSELDDFGLDRNVDNAISGKDLSKFEQGSISTRSPIVPDEYDYYTLGVLNTDLGENNKSDFWIAPNPQFSNTEFNIKYRLPTETGTIRIFSPESKEVLDQKISGKFGILTVPGINSGPGIYVVGITSSDGDMKYKKLVIVSKQELLIAVFEINGY